MAILAELLLEHGIRPRSFAEGSRKMLCPQCSDTRRNRKDPCLTLTIDSDGVGAVWNCHHCGWSGAVNEREGDRPARLHRQRLPRAKPSQAPTEPSSAVLRWLAARGISEATARRHGIGSARHYIPKLGAEVDCIAFPYFRRGELVNIKYRAISQKAFAQVKGAEKIFYGLDDIADSKEAIIVEGECDKLAHAEAGIRNVVSVPDGAPQRVKAGDPDPDDAKFAFLANCAEDFAQHDRIILALDNDEPGRALAEELARRFGKERCWRVRWPDSGDAPCKDANEVLLMHGPDVLRECIDNAEPYPITGLHSVLDYADETLALYRDGRKHGLSTGWRSLDEYFTIRPGELSLVTGVPGSGKSEFIDAMMINLANQYGWRHAVCSFENPPEEHISKLQTANRHPY